MCVSAFCKAISCSNSAFKSSLLVKISVRAARSAPRVMKLHFLRSIGERQAGEEVQSSKSFSSSTLNFEPLNFENYFSERRVRFEPFVCGAHVFEGERGVEDGPHEAAREEGDDVRGEAPDGVRLILRGARAQDRACYPQTLAHRAAEVERGTRAAERADEQQATAIAERVEVCVEVRRADEIKNDVHARAKRPLAHRVGEGARVAPDRDAFIHAELARPLDLLQRARRAVNRARACRPRELHSRRADA